MYASGVFVTMFVCNSDSLVSWRRDTLETIMAEWVSLVLVGDIKKYSSSTVTNLIHI